MKKSILLMAIIGSFSVNANQSLRDDAILVEDIEYKLAAGFKADDVVYTLPEAAYKSESDAVIEAAQGGGRSHLFMATWVKKFVEETLTLHTLHSLVQATFTTQAAILLRTSCLKCLMATLGSLSGFGALIPMFQKTYSSLHLRGVCHHLSGAQ